MPALGKYTDAKAPACADGSKSSGGDAPTSAFYTPKKRGEGKTTFTREGQPYNTSNTKFGFKS